MITQRQAGDAVNRAQRILEWVKHQLKNPSGKLRAESALNSQRRAIEVVQDLSRSLADQCKSKGLNLMGIYLVGSRARGDYGAESDLDLIILLDGIQNLSQFERMKIFLDLVMELKSPVAIEYRVYTPQEWLEEDEWICSMRRDCILINS